MVKQGNAVLFERTEARTVEVLQMGSTSYFVKERGKIAFTDPMTHGVISNCSEKRLLEFSIDMHLCVFQGHISKLLYPYN